MKDFEGMTDDERFEAVGKAMNWCIGMLQELESHGLAHGDDDAPRLIPKGTADFEQLRASGWRPPKDLAMAVLEELGGADAELLWKMICKWCEGQN